MEAGILIGLWLVLPLLIVGCILLRQHGNFSQPDLYVVGAAFLCGVLSTAAGVFIWLGGGFTVNTIVTLCVAILCHSVLLVVVWTGGTVRGQFPRSSVSFRRRHP